MERHPAEKLLSDDRDSGEVERRKMTAPGDSVSLVVQNLRPGTTYDFRVSAENKHGVSRESQTVSAQMLDEGAQMLQWNILI